MPCLRLGSGLRENICATETTFKWQREKGKSGEISSDFVPEWWMKNTRIPIINSLYLFLANTTCIAHGRGSACFSPFIIFFRLRLLFFSVFLLLSAATLERLHTIFAYVFVNSLIASSVHRSVHLTSFNGQTYIWIFSQKFQLVVGQPKCRSRRAY